jgi:hypothetical protein
LTIDRDAELRKVGQVEISGRIDEIPIIHRIGVRGLGVDMDDLEEGWGEDAKGAFARVRQSEVQTVDAFRRDDRQGACAVGEQYQECESARGKMGRFMSRTGMEPETSEDCSLRSGITLKIAK